MEKIFAFGEFWSLCFEDDFLVVQKAENALHKLADLMAILVKNAQKAKKILTNSSLYGKITTEQYLFVF